MLVDFKRPTSQIKYLSSFTSDEWIKLALSNPIGILINDGAFTHTSISIRDALIGSKIPFVELHISNIFSREDFRKESFLTDKAVGIISGFGISSYSLALEGIIGYLSNKD